MFGIPYATVVIVEDEGAARVCRQCPECGTLVPESTDSTGEQTTNDYAAHYADKHATRPTALAVELAGLDRMFDRDEARARARTVECPSCDAAPGSQCRDRWGNPTGLVHEHRHQAVGNPASVDVYAMW